VTVVVEIAGLELAGSHGALEAERREPQPFLYDVELELEEPASDELVQTADYREAVALIRDVSQSRQFHLLESLAATVADTMLERFPAARSVYVRVRKPHVELGLPLDYTAASVRRERR
jgi:7,8-dihydroneopterin aldolase/epimerase/oxygenase